MCGRFLLTSPIEALRRIFGVSSGLNIPARYNIAPTQSTVVVRRTAEGGRELVLLRWGLVPSWAKDLSIGAKLINARADTVATKPSFRAAFRQRRCLVPADGFYEWKETQPGKPKQPYLIARADRQPFAFAGLWEHWQDGQQTVETFTLITTDANATLMPIHHRMPVILAATDYATWLDPASKGAEALLKPAPDDLLATTPISTRVNSVRNDEPGLIEPVADAPAAAPATKSAGKKASSQGSLF
ncbi:MAG: SOS response-associated peptidase [Rhodospirillales bacterium]|nr:SOS response-associated peptidase [Rhodospirillales bacterium]